MALKEYRKKRNFRRTSEPAGSGRPRRPGAEPFFVVQKHDATRLHYDFRLALDGVLKSWAVPKGFPRKRGERRLAVQVEDHPMDYAQFEGIIPEGNYGAGTVMVWDTGPYQVFGDDPAASLEQGKLHFTLQGKKLNGEWTLVRLRARPHESKPSWLLLKSGDDLPSLSARREDQSVLTGRSLKQIATDHDATWPNSRSKASSNHQLTPPRRAAARTRGNQVRSVKPSVTDHAARAFKVDLGTERLPERGPAFVEPMKAVLTDQLPRGPGWIYEVKFDGVRALAIKDKNEIRLLSRNEKRLNEKYPEVAEALRRLPVRQAVIDGEIVALESTGRSSFQLLQTANLPGAQRPPIFFYVFDLIQLDGRDLTGLPLLKRKVMAEQLVATVRGIARFSAGIQASTDRLLKAMKARGLEGLIAKQKDSKYEIGRRSRAWVKFKWTNEQEFVIGGHTAPRGARSHFGAILVGYYERGKLRFASKVGTGFDERRLQTLHQQFQKLARPGCPFVNLPEKGSGRGRLTVAEMKRCTWLEPRLVCQVRFGEWTRDGHLRQPVFLGLREDKKVREVVREQRP